MFLLSAIILIGIAMAVLAAVLDTREQRRIEQSIGRALCEVEDSANELQRAINRQAHLSE
jgi:hypothetical protein